MTAYELMDVRASVSESYMSAMRFWMTATLACFGAGNFIEGGDAAVSFILLSAFYTSLTISMGLYLRQLGKEIHAVEADLLTYAEAHPGCPTVVTPAVVNSRYMSRPMQFVIALVLPIVLAVYFYGLYAS